MADILQKTLKKKEITYSTSKILSGINIFRIRLIYKNQ